MIEIDTALNLLKLDLGITHNLRDEYYYSMLQGANKELERKGITIDLNSMDDQMLLSDYTAYNYRNRSLNVPLSANLQLRIRNRIVRQRSVIDATT